MKNSQRRIPHASKLSRRRFLGGLAAATAFSVVPRHVLGGEGHVAPSEKTTLAGIGVGGQGIQNMLRFADFPEIQIAAVCDVHREGDRYMSWNWSQGKDTRLAGREPARRAIEAKLCRAGGQGQVPRLQRLRRLPRAA